jgi:hypothetical protein
MQTGPALLPLLDHRAENGAADRLPHALRLGRVKASKW